MKIRGFEIVSRFLDSMISIPKRSTKGSAGYDFSSAVDMIIKPKEMVQVPTGIKAFFPHSEVLLLFNRSSTAAKYNLLLPNGVGVIDADYYNNENNEGEISVLLYNFGESETFIKKGQRLAQGIFIKYETTTDEEEIREIRTGGFGSSGK